MLALLLCAQAAGATTATDVRIGDHPAFVRAVVDFSGGAVEINEVQTTDPRPFDGLTRIRVAQAGIRTVATVEEAQGIRVRVTQGTDRLRIGIRSAVRRFKYVSYDVVGQGRLAIDLWKSRPPSAAAEVRRGPGGCLTLDDLAVGVDAVTASGRERQLFEHQLVTVLRGRGGGIVAQRPVLAANRSWSARLPYEVLRRQAGTFEAIAASAKDGSLVCLVQARVTLSAGPSS
jgi:hypothetical protein